MTKDDVKGHGCNILIDCFKCGTIFYDIIPSIQCNSYDMRGNYYGSKWRKIENKDIVLFLRKNNWRQLFTGGYICENCYKKLKNIKTHDISKDIGFIKDHS